MIVKFNSKKTRMLKQINKLLGFFFHTNKEETLIDFNSIKEVLIIDPNMIGDMVMLEPFLRIIKKNIPNCRITLVCSKWAQDIFQNEELVDKYIFVTKFAFNNQWTSIKNKRILNAALLEINKNMYDMALEPRGDLRYIYFMHKCKARRKISYNYTGGECFLTDVILPGENIEHLVDDKLFFLKSLQFKFTDEERYPVLHLSDQQISENHGFIKDHNFQNRYVIGIHPGASLEIKQWKKYDELLARISSINSNAAFILFEGPGEKNAVDVVEKMAIRCNSKYVRSKTCMSEYIRLVALCNLMICNDSGAGHIAAALGCNVITIFGPVLPSLAKPYAKDGIYVASNEFVCKPCTSSKCAKDGKCIESVTVDQVFELFLENLES